jgi:hypothetical protein
VLQHNLICLHGQGPAASCVDGAGKLQRGHAPIFEEAQVKACVLGYRAKQQKSILGDKPGAAGNTSHAAYFVKF